MSFLTPRIKDFLSLQKPFPWMLLCFALWVVSFYPFLLSKNALTSDALSYYDHTKYFVENLRTGVFPLWDHYWQYGASNDFFLRRIGCYNPLYLFMAMVSALGVSFREVYLFVHGGYYFLGAIGMFFLGRRVWGDARPAFMVFVLFLFSGIGARIFDSYMSLVVVPLVWFFYFAFRFLSCPDRLGMGGLVFTAMILMSTYVPLYFVTIVLVFLLFWILLFPREAFESAKRALVFLQQDFWFSLCMAVVFFISLVPLAAFFRQAGDGAVVMTQRHGASGMANALGVDKKLLDWGLIEDLFFSGYYTDLRRYILAIVYVPCSALILWVLGSFCRLNRRIILYFIVGIFFVLLGTPKALPLHDFLYQHIFYFKYFRNLHFFLWFLIIPLFIFTAGEFLHQGLKCSFQTYGARVRCAAVVVVVHAAILTWILWVSSPLPTTLAVVILSMLFCSAAVIRPEFFLHGALFWLAVVGVTVPQAMQVYHFAAVNMEKYAGAYAYDAVGRQFAWIRPVNEGIQSETNRCSSLYYSSSSFYDFCMNTSPDIFRSQMRYALVAYQRVAPFEDGGYAHLNVTGKIEALASGWSTGGSIFGSGPAEYIEPADGRINVLSSHSGQLKLTTDFKEDRFLVYNDSWDPHWRAYIDGKAVRLYKANGAFKGLHVPSGKHTVEFSYGDSRWIFLNWFLWAVFNVFFCWMLWEAWKLKQKAKQCS